MQLIAVCYGTGCLSSIVLIALMVIRQRPTGLGLYVLGVYTITALWAVVTASQFPALRGTAQLLDGIRLVSWLEFLALVFVNASTTDGTKASSFYKYVIPAICLIVIGNDFRFFQSAENPFDYSASQILGRIFVSVFGLLLIENLFRNIPSPRRWHILPLCIAAGLIFAYDLFVFLDAVIARHLDPIFLAGRGVVLTLVVPPLIVSMARNQSWNVNIHVSRRVVFHTATLTIGGIFLIVSAGIAGFVGRIPGDWGALLRLTFFVGSIVALATALSVGSLRSRLARTLSENFFSTRYDYRTEWVRCITTLSSSSDRDTLQARIIRAFADVVDSPGGILWLKNVDGNYLVATTLNLALSGPADEAEDGVFAAGFDRGNKVQILSPPSNDAPLWVKNNSRVWLSVPLVLMDEIIGFVTLAKPRAPQVLNWESYDLLLTIGRQGASWLSEELAARALAESQTLFEYSKRFSFVAHDVKNVSSQLGIMITNMKMFGDEPEFRADMVKTMEASINRLNALLDRLKPGSTGASKTGVNDIGNIIKSVLSDLNNADVKMDLPDVAISCNTIAEHDLYSILTHLVTNGVEASALGSPVFISLKSVSGCAEIFIKDKGRGMEPEFIKDELFTPLKSTKRRGHGVGAFQARELIRAAGGTLEVTSAPCNGTVFKISLPCEPGSEVVSGRG